MAGTAAATVVPSLVAVSPALAGLLLVAAQRRTRGRSRLPRATRRKVAAVMRRLRPGAARRLLADVALATDAVYPALRQASGARAGPQIDAFVAHACDASIELGDVDELLATLEHGGEDRLDAPDSWKDAMALTERRRDALVQRLLDTLARLARMSHFAAQAESSGPGQLEEMSAALETALREHGAAMREVEQALKA